MRPDAVEPWLALVGPGLEAEPLLTLSFFLGPTRLADLAGECQSFRTPDAVAAAYRVKVATLGRFLAASPEMCGAVAAAILGPEGLAAWHARDWPTDPAERHSQAGVGWTDKYLGALRLFAIYCLPKINRAGLPDDEVLAMANYSHGFLKAATAEACSKAIGFKKKGPAAEMKALVNMPLPPMPLATRAERNAGYLAWHNMSEADRRHVDAERDAVYLAWHNMSETARLRVEAEARRRGLRLLPGQLREARAAICGAQRALARDDISADTRAGLDVLLADLTAAGDDEFACAEAWAIATVGARFWAECEADEPLLIYPTEHGPLCLEAVIVAASLAIEAQRRGRSPKFKRSAAEGELAADYMRLTGLSKRDWSRVSDNGQPRGCYSIFLRKVDSIYGESIEGGLKLTEEL